MIFSNAPLDKELFWGGFAPQSSLLRGNMVPWLNPAITSIVRGLEVAHRFNELNLKKHLKLLCAYRA